MHADQDFHTWNKISIIMESISNESNIQHYRKELTKNL